MFNVGIIFLVFNLKCDPVDFGRKHSMAMSHRLVTFTCNQQIQLKHSVQWVPGLVIPGLCSFGFIKQQHLPKHLSSLSQTLSLHSYFLYSLNHYTAYSSIHPSILFRYFGMHFQEQQILQLINYTSYVLSSLSRN